MNEAQRRYKNNISKPYKSWGEEQIAKLLDRNGINHKYENPLAVVDRGKVRIWYPDFYLPGCGLIIEYFGVKGEKAYDDQAKHKIAVYEQNGIEGLFLTEDCFKGDWPARIMGQIEGILKGRLDRFYNRRCTQRG